MNRLFGVLTLLVLASCIGFSVAIFCYECSGIRQQSCMSPGKDLLRDCTSNIGICFKTYSKVNTVESVARGCGKYAGPTGSGIGDNQCQDHDIEGVKTNICNCNTEQCNSAVGLSKTSLISLGLGAVALILLC